MKIINVTAAIIERDGKFLIAKRAKGKHLENKWEFPGGKIEKGESAKECLIRELKEEFGINIEVNGLVAESIFDYGDRKIRLLGYRAKYLSGEFILTAHEEIKWINPAEFSQFDFAPADIPLLKSICDGLTSN